MLPAECRQERCTQLLSAGLLSALLILETFRPDHIFISSVVILIINFDVTRLPVGVRLIDLELVELDLKLSSFVCRSTVIVMESSLKHTMHPLFLVYVY